MLRAVKPRLTVQSYCDKQARILGDSVSFHANHNLWQGAVRACALLGLCLAASPVAAQEKPELRPAVASGISPYPLVSDVRVAGDEKHTRFILDIDRKVELRAFALANPNRVVLDVPQTTFQLPAGVGEASRGLVKAFRYGLVMPGGSRIVMDLKRPAKIDKAYVLDGENGQPPKLIVELSATDRATFMQAIATENRRAMAESSQPTTVAAIPTPAAASAAVAGPEAADTRPVVIIDPGHGGIDQGTQAASGENEKDIVLDFAKALRERIEKAGKYRVVMTRSDSTLR